MVVVVLVVVVVVVVVPVVVVVVGVVLAVVLVVAVVVLVVVVVVIVLVVVVASPLDGTEGAMARSCAAPVSACHQFTTGHHVCGRRTACRSRRWSRRCRPLCTNSRSLTSACK